MFFPASVLMPVLPPTAASTMPSNVVGTWTTLTPRIQVAAANPARSVTDPPPSPITTSRRSSPICPNTFQQKPSTVRFLASSASGTCSSCASMPASRTASRMTSAVAARVGGWMSAARPAPVAAHGLDQVAQQSPADQHVVRRGGRDVHGHRVGRRPALMSAHVIPRVSVAEWITGSIAVSTAGVRPSPSMIALATSSTVSSSVGTTMVATSRYSGSRASSMAL